MVVYVPRVQKLKEQLPLPQWLKDYKSDIADSDGWQVEQVARADSYGRKDKVSMLLLLLCVKNKLIMFQFPLTLYNQMVIFQCIYNTVSYIQEAVVIAYFKEFNLDDGVTVVLNDVVCSFPLG
jgi:hypothetical protein